MSFSAEVDRATKQMVIDSERVFQGTCLSLASKVVKRTPVDEGTARNNWFTGINVEPTDQKREGKKAASEALSDAANAAASLSLHDTFFFVNRVPYIMRLEFGWSKQAPQGMLRATIASFNRIVSALKAKR